MKTLFILLFGLCDTEDSVNCVWDARVQGNGEGISFLYVEAGQSEVLLLLGN
ncbi:MAG TPA: hypothetical protein PK181_05015 [Methanothrix soehngenii]|nr:hypothetical protein [Methanothrix soehngenii]